jgi:hypothetical protein
VLGLPKVDKGNNCQFDGDLYYRDGQDVAIPPPAGTRHQLNIQNSRGADRSVRLLVESALG